MSIEPAFIFITLDIRYAYLQTLLAFTLNTNWPPQKIWIKGKVNILNACQKKPFCTKNCFTRYSHPHPFSRKTTLTTGKLIILGNILNE